MAGYDENFAQLPVSSNGTSSFDKPDIGAIQYEEHPNEWIRYGFPSVNQHNGIRWMSFPTADRIYGNLDTVESLFGDLHDNLSFSSMQWKPFDSDDNIEIHRDVITNEWFHWDDYRNDSVNPLQGYKFTMSSPNTTSVITKGIYPEIDTDITLRAVNSDGEPNENWVGYFKHQTVSPLVAFANIIDNLYYIQTQNWTMARVNTPGKNLPWIYAGCGGDNPSPHTISYGDMAIVKCYVNGSLFWGTDGPELEPYEKEITEYYHYVEKPEYKPFFIEFVGTNLPKEVGLYIDEICMGAAKVVGKLTEVPGYLYEGLPEFPEIEFRLYFEEKSNDIIPEYTTYNNQTGEYTNETLTLNDKQDFYMVKINTGDEGCSPIPKLYVSNYPNPFHSTTRIEYYVPKDSNISIDIFNVKGQKVNNLVNCYQNKGVNHADWDGKDSIGRPVSNGVYFTLYNYLGRQITKKMIFLK
ncbi:MAG: T9SS type A sorting domain-containing protein [Candidatus Cloacimonadaceae bacterium]